MSAREGHIPVPGASLKFRALGAGLPLVALHGGPDFDHRYLVPELDRLASRFRLIYYDQRGRGGSAAGVAPDDVGLASEVGDLDRVRAHFGLGTMALLGHSWGCVLALEYAIRHPGRVSHLVLMNAAPVSHADRARMRQHRQATEAEALAAMHAIASTPLYEQGDVATEASYYRLHYGGTLQGALLDSLLGRLRVDASPRDILRARAIEERLYADTWDAQDYDLTARLGNCAIPTLVIHGERDFVPLSCARAIADALRNASLVVLDDCGHFAYLERPAAVERAIAAFLQHEHDA